MKQHSVLIVSEDGDFARALIKRWSEEKIAPEFTLVSAASMRTKEGVSADLAVLDARGLAQEAIRQLLRKLEDRGAQCICVHRDALQLKNLRAGFPRVLPVGHAENWTETVVVLGGEVLRRCEVTHRWRRTEAGLQEQAHYAALGRYMVEARHGFNNALTSVLGNAELLLLESSALPSGMQEQVDTIQSMALRLHEMMQRFSSLETEMQVSERDSVGKAKARAYASGS